MLWAMESQKDKMWIRWVDAYYMKGRSVAEFRVPQTFSWMLKKIFSCYTYVVQCGGWDQVQHRNQFSIARVYKLCLTWPV